MKSLFVLFGLLVAQFAHAQGPELPDICTQGLQLKTTTFVLSDDTNENSDALQFGPFGKDISELKFELNIYSRWGALLYNSTNPEESWDFVVDDERVTPGTYIYQITYSCYGLYENQKERVGHVKLVK